jgi:aldose 1-epimerase
MCFDSRDFDDINFPFAFSARASYELDGADFVMSLTLLNEDARPFPAGMGHHPYFVRNMGVDADAACVKIPARQNFSLVAHMAVAAPVPVSPDLDFHTPRPLGGTERDEVLTDLDPEAGPIRLSYPDHGVAIDMLPDPIFQHIVLYTPAGKPFFAVEPVTNTNDGFNLFAQGVPDTGVFVLEPGERRSARVILRAAES